MKCVPYVQHILNYFHCFCTSTIKIVPVQTILYQFKLFCPSSKNKLFQSKNWTTTSIYPYPCGHVYLSLNKPFFFSFSTQINFTVAIDFTASNGKMPSFSNFRSMHQFSGLVKELLSLYWKHIVVLHEWNWQDMIYYWLHFCGPYSKLWPMIFPVISFWSLKKNFMCFS